MLGILVWTCVSALTVGLSGPAGSDATTPEPSVEVPAAEATTSVPNAVSPEPDATTPEPSPESAEATVPEPEPSAESAAAAPEPEPSTESTEPEPEQPAAPATGTAPPPAVLPPPSTPIEVDPRNYRMVLGGDIVIALGGAGFIALFAGLGIRSDAVAQRQALTVSDAPDLDAIAHQEQRIQNGSITALVGGVAAVSLFATGITLVALGYRRERERRESLPIVTIGSQGAALSWSLRF